jgi:hypothetical protein
MKRSHTLTFAASLMALAGCSKMMNKSPAPVSQAEKESDAEAKLCKNMSKSNPSIQDYPAVTEGTSLEEVKSANQEVETAVREVLDDSKSVNAPGLLEIQSALQKLQNSVNAVPGGRDTVGPAADSVQANAQELRQAWEKVYNRMQCGA